MAIYLSRRWRRQPTYPARIVRGSPLDGAAWVWSGAFPIYDAAIGLVGNSVGYAPIATRYGIAASSGSTAGNSNYVEMPTNPLIGAGGHKTVFLWLRSENGTTSGNWDSIISNFMGGSAVNYYGITTFDSAPDKGKPYFEIYDNGGTNKSTGLGSTAALSTTDYQWLVGTIDSSTISLYQGKTVTASAGTSGVLPSANALPWRVGLRINANTGAPQSVLLAGVINRCLSTSEVAALQDEPWAAFAPQRRVLYFGGAAPAGDVNVNLTGLGTTSAQGSVTPNTNVAVSGQAATSQQGTLTPAESVGIGGQAGTGQQGSVGPTTNVTLAGQAATTEQGTLTPVKAGETSVTLTGLAATAQQGTLAPAAAIPLTGLAGTTQQGDVTPTQGIVVALTGLSATAAKGDMGVTTNVGMAGNVVSIDIGQLGYPGQEVATPARQVGAGKSRKVKRRRVIIGERAYWVSESELPGLLKTMLERAEPEVPEAEEAPKPKTQPKVEREDDAEEIVARIVPQDAPEAEPWQALFERLQAQFQANEDAAAVAALVEARARLIREELDEDDAEFLMLVG